MIKSLERLPCTSNTLKTERTKEIFLYTNYANDNQHEIIFFKDNQNTSKHLVMMKNSQRSQSEHLHHSHVQPTTCSSHHSGLPPKSGLIYASCGKKGFFSAVVTKQIVKCLGQTNLLYLIHIQQL